MQFASEFTPISLGQLHHEAAVMKVDGWRFIQTHAVNTDAGVDLYYSFMKDGAITNLKVEGVTKDQLVPSITDLFLAAFVFENEARELFGVDMRDIAIDFAGAMYAPATQEPMTFLSPEQKAAREKARKAQAAKEAKESMPAAPEAAGAAQPGRTAFVMTPERRERLDKKLATMSPDKVAKVQAALKAREAEAAGNAQAGGAGAGEKAADAGAPTDAKPAAVPDAGHAAAPASAKPQDSELESKIALMDPQKAQAVKAALRARSGEEPEPDAAEQPAAASDALLESKIALMDESKAHKVREALAARAQGAAQRKGGE